MAPACSSGAFRFDQGVMRDPAWDVLLVGTDVNRESLRFAREGRYSARSFRATPDQTRERYFEAVGRVRRAISVMEIELVLLARMAFGAAIPSRSPKILANWVQ